MSVYRLLIRVAGCVMLPAVFLVAGCTPRDIADHQGESPPPAFDVGAAPRRGDLFCGCVLATWGTRRGASEYDV